MPADVPPALDELNRRIAARREEGPEPHEPVSLGERAADLVAAGVGSWVFVIAQSSVIVGWIVYNSLNGKPIDPFPFILLNLILSFQAAYTAPIIMMSQNRLGEIDRRRSQADYDINRKAELEIELLHQKIDLLRERELAAMAISIERLTKMLEESARR